VETSHLLDGGWSWLLTDGLDFAFIDMDSLCGDHITQKYDLRG